LSERRVRVAGNGDYFYSELAQQLSNAQSAEKRFLWIVRRLDLDRGNQILSLNLPGIHSVFEPKRFYPNGSLASHVLGYVGIDGEGLGGLEHSYNSKIKGEPGELFLERDATGRAYESYEIPAKAGQTVLLTIDQTIQYHAERALQDAVQRTHAKSGTAIVLDPRTGEILALANAPTFDPNKVSDSSAEARSNWALQNIYEPGSTFKIVAYSAAIDRGLANVEKIYGEAVKRGLMSEEKAKQGRARICGSTAPMELRDVQFVIEATSEKMEIKKEVFRELAMEAGPKTIVATNTSALSVSELAEVTISPEHVIGLHFFNPVSRMKLVEVVIAKQTSDETRDRSLAFVRQIGKLPVIVRDSPGFLVNRVLFPYLLDAAELFESGVDPKRIDSAMVAWGMPMGPLRLIDEIGVDVTIDIGNTLEKAYGQRDHVPIILLWLRDQEMLGRKTGAGLYKYENKSQKPNDSLVKWRRGLHGDPEGVEGPNIPPDKYRDPRLRFNDERLAHRMVFLMVNEAARCLEEGVVGTPEDADYGMILGTGFAPFRGGPLRFGEHLGLKRIVDDLERLARNEKKFTPCETLKKHARDGTKFYEE